MPRSIVRRLPIDRVTADPGHAVACALPKRTRFLGDGCDGRRLPFR